MRRTAEEFLTAVYEQEFLLEALEGQLEKIRKEIYTVKGQRYDIPRVSGSKSSDLSDPVEKLMKYEAKVNIEWDKMIDMRDQAAELLKEIQDNKIRAVMIERFINHRSWDQIAAKRMEAGHRCTWRYAMQMSQDGIRILSIRHPNGIEMN